MLDNQSEAEWGLIEFMVRLPDNTVQNLYHLKFLSFQQDHVTEEEPSQQENEWNFLESDRD